MADDLAQDVSEDVVVEPYRNRARESEDGRVQPGRGGVVG